MAVDKMAKGITAAVIMSLSSTMGQIFLAGWMLPLAFVRPESYRVWSDFWVAAWVFMTTALMEKLLGIKMVISGDVIRPRERNMIIMNHRTRLDWMYFWSVLVRQSGIITEKIVLKNELKHIPGAGWAMQAGGFIFLKRKWDLDKKVLQDCVDYYSDLKHKTQVLIFPEGTDFTPRTKIRSDEFARKNNLRTYDYVLHPRTTGFTFMTQRMREAGHLDAVYDVSIGYPCNFPHSEPEFVLGKYPREVHFHIKRYSVDEMPESEDGLRDWCCQRWAEKEEDLKQFYKDGSFKTLAGGPTQNSKNTREEQYLALRFYLTVLLWCVFIVVASFCLYYFAFFRWMAATQVLFYVGMGYYGGFEIFQWAYYNRLFGGKEK